MRNKLFAAMIFTFASQELKTPFIRIKRYLDLPDLSKIQSGQSQLNIKDFVINELLNETMFSIQLLSLTHEIIKEQNNHGDLVISADRQKI